MLLNTKIVITGIVALATVDIALVLTLAYLAVHNADASTILSVVSTIVSVITLLRVGALHGILGQVQQQTNGAQQKLIEAAIQSTPPVRAAK